MSKLYLVAFIIACVVIVCNAHPCKFARAPQTLAFYEDNYKLFSKLPTLRPMIKNKHKDQLCTNLVISGTLSNNFASTEVEIVNLSNDKFCITYGICMSCGDTKWMIDTLEIYLDTGYIFTESRNN